MKNIEVDSHFIGYTMMQYRIVTSFVTSSCYLVISLLKFYLERGSFILCNKLGMIDIYAPALALRGIFCIGLL